MVAKHSVVQSRPNGDGADMMGAAPG
jgi:hypothetical protein